MLLRNLQSPKICNGTRLEVQSLCNWSLHLNRLLQGWAFISRISLIASDLPFQFKYCSFRSRFALGWQLNKSQGQSLGVVGVDLRHNYFSHSHLYVSCSRVSSSATLQPDGRTHDVVKKFIRQVVVHFISNILTVNGCVGSSWSSALLYLYGYLTIVRLQVIRRCLGFLCGRVASAIGTTSLLITCGRLSPCRWTINGTLTSLCRYLMSPKSQCQRIEII